MGNINLNDAIRLRNAVVCMDCQCVAESFHSTCSVCQSTSIYPLFRLIQSVTSEAVATTGQREAEVAVLERLYKFHT